MDDIIDAINAGSNYQHPVTRQTVSEHLQIPPIDLLIRTGGEKRLSNGTNRVKDDLVHDQHQKLGINA